MRRKRAAAVFNALGAGLRRRRSLDSDKCRAIAKHGTLCDVIDIEICFELFEGAFDNILDLRLVLKLTSYTKQNGLRLSQLQIAVHVESRQPINDYHLFPGFQWGK